MNYGNNEAIALRLRDMPLNSAVPNEDLVVIPREPQCNPITWQCPDPDPYIARRCIE